MGRRNRQSESETSNISASGSGILQLVFSLCFQMFLPPLLCVLDTQTIATTAVMVSQHLPHDHHHNHRRRWASVETPSNGLYGNSSDGQKSGGESGQMFREPLSSTTLTRHKIHNHFYNSYISSNCSTTLGNHNGKRKKTHRTRHPKNSTLPNIRSSSIAVVPRKTSHESRRSRAVASGNEFMALKSDIWERDFTHYNVGVLMLVSGTGSMFDKERCSPAVDMALDRVNEYYLRPHKIRLHKVEVRETQNPSIDSGNPGQGDIWFVACSYPTCDNNVTPGLAADLKFKSNVIAFIGPACGFALEPVALLSAYWNIPIVTGLGDQPPSTESEVSGDKLLGGLKQKLRLNSTGVFENKSEYPTLTRMSYCQCRLKLVFDAICKRFKWKHLAVIYDKMDLFSFTVGRILINGLKDADYEVYAKDVDGTYLPDLDEALEEISPHARIVVLSLQESLVREFMLKAHARGYTSSGEWAFLDVELFKNKPSETNIWQKGDATDLKAKEAYVALMTVSLHIPYKSSKWSNFSNNVKERALEDYNYTFPGDEEVSFFIGAFYDGVILLGMALNETLVEEGDITNGTGITQKMWGRSFEGITGNVSIDENGDRDGEFSILDLNSATGHFEVVAKFASHTGLVVKGNRTVQWPGGKGPPSDIPECGFSGHDERCLVTRASVISLPYIAGIIGVLLLLIVIGAFYVYKRVREVEAASSTKWRLMPEDVILDGSNASGEQHAKQQQEKEESSRGSLSLGTGVAGYYGCGGVTGSTFVPTAVYKGNQVALRRLSLYKKIEFTKHIIAEIRQVKDLQNENIVHLVGLCLSCSDTTKSSHYHPASSEKNDQILVLTEYCSRGSLRDVLLNVHIHLDWPFKLSLVSDIVHGMNYLHSNIGPHGRLSSSKCLVDARFVVKIADFGLHTLRSFQKKNTQNLTVAEQFTKLMWTAPEHVSAFASSILSGANTAGNLSQSGGGCNSLAISTLGHKYSLKGDAYSFGIILYEVATRSAPYFTFSNLSPEEIVSNVMASSVPPFRPHLTDDMAPTEIRTLMQNCWTEPAEDRPDFSQIKASLRRMMKGAGAVSLVDDLLRRLEQHALHLEVLVEDKTRELEQEKRRSEDLLYQVLPRQVAEQLLRGETVSPESFEAVTVYFSDIVGFTSICAQSSPIQVVDFLNNLYGTFDGILDNFDAYKVETIGDAYMVVSGAPMRNGDLHATEIAYLCLAVLDAVQNYEIGHLPEEQLKIRIGIHTGPICAGVVGHRMPHYCLFGDTVNTSSRMESSGLPLKIHVSATTARALEVATGFHLLPRGEVMLKGKGFMKTYWLEGCEDDTHWQRTRKLHSSSKDSIQTKCSTNPMSSSHPIPTQSHQQQSTQSPQQRHSHNSSGLYSPTPSYNLTSIWVTPAD